MDFITMDMFATVAGCSAIITILTQVFKKYLPENIDSKWLALIFSVIIGVVRIFYIGQFDYSGIVTGIVNIFVLLGVSIGLYEIGDSVMNKIKK